MQKTWMEKLQKEGYKNLQICANEPSKDFPEHTHEATTVHVILEGEITLIEKDGNKVLKKGDYFEIPAGTTHRAKAGPDGCTFIVGVKSDA